MGSPVLRIEVSSTSLRMELSMSDTRTVSPLRQRMIEDMAARKLNPHTQRSHISSCKRFAAWLKRSSDTATPDEVRRELCKGGYRDGRSYRQTRARKNGQIITGETCLFGGRRIRRLERCEDPLHRAHLVPLLVNIFAVQLGDAAEWRPAHTRHCIALLIEASEDLVIFFGKVMQVGVEFDEARIRQQIHPPTPLSEAPASRMGATSPSGFSSYRSPVVRLSRTPPATSRRSSSPVQTRSHRRSPLSNGIR